MKTKNDIRRNAFMLEGSLAKCGYDWWWHSFTGIDDITGEEKAFFIEFFTCNPALGGPEPIYGQLKENRERGIRPSYLMVKAGAWGENAVQLHRFFGWDDVNVSPLVPFSISAGNCELSEHHTSGSVSITSEAAFLHPEWMRSSGEMLWDLKIRKIIPFNVGYGASTPFRKSQAFEMFWHAEGMKTAYEGKVIFNGRSYTVSPDTCYGYADKNWGSNFTSPWVWLSSCNLMSRLTGRRLKRSVFDIGGGRPKVGPVSLDRKLLASMCYEGKFYEFNFSKFWTMTKTEFNCTESEDEIIWHVDQSTPLHRMVTDITCPKREMLLVNYEAPNGEKKHNRLWNGGTGEGTVKLYDKRRGGDYLIDEIEARNVGCEYGEF